MYDPVLPQQATEALARIFAMYRKAPREATPWLRREGIGLSPDLLTNLRQFGSTPTPRQLQDTSDVGSPIETRAELARAADQILAKTKSLDQSVSSVFASSQSPDAPPADFRSLITATNDAIPLQNAVDITSFAVLLNASGRTAAINR